MVYRLHWIRIYHLLYVDVFREYWLGSTGDVESNGELDTLVGRSVSLKVQLVVVYVGKLVGEQLDRQSCALARSHHIVLVRSKLKGIARVDVHIRRSDTACLAMVHDTTETEYANLHTVRIEVVLELERTILAQDNLEVHALHHGVAIVLVRYHYVVLVSLIVYTVS